MITFKREEPYTDVEIEELISWVEDLRIPGKAEILRTLKTLRGYAKTRALKDAPGTSLFIILNKISYIDDYEEIFDNALDFT